MVSLGSCLRPRLLDSLRLLPAPLLKGTMQNISIDAVHWHGLDWSVAPLQAWHYEGEAKSIDAHYRVQLDALSSAKLAAEAELAALRAAGAKSSGSTSSGAAQQQQRLPPPHAMPAVPTAQLQNGKREQQPPAPALPAAAGQQLLLPQKGIRSGNVVDASRRSVAPELQLLMARAGSGAAPPPAPPAAKVRATMHCGLATLRALFCAAEDPLCASICTRALTGDSPATAACRGMVCGQHASVLFLLYVLRRIRWTTRRWWTCCWASCRAGRGTRARSRPRTTPAWRCVPPIPILIAVCRAQRCYLHAGMQRWLQIQLTQK